jgi:hypothetical protein
VQLSRYDDAPAVSPYRTAHNPNGASHNPNGASGYAQSGHQAPGHEGTAFDFEGLEAHLGRLLRRAGGPAGLVTDCPGLVDMLCPALPARESTLHERAITTYRILQDGAAALDPPFGEAARIMLGLCPDAQGQPLGQRRRRAAALYGLKPDTFRRRNHQRRLLLEVTFGVYRRVHPEPRLRRLQPR